MAESNRPVGKPASGRKLSRLTPRGPGPAGSLGCIAFLGSLLTLLGAGAVALPFLASDPDAWIAVVVGTGFGLVGLVLLWGAVRGARARSLPPPEVTATGELEPRAGASFWVRVVQPGPVELEKLTLALTCERRYRRRVRRNSTATVDDSELLWERKLLEVRGESVPAGGCLERLVEVEIPPDARPTGPALPDGRIRWTLELAIEAGFLRGWRTDFEIEVAA